MADKEKSSSPAATAKGTAPSNYKYFSSLPPIFQVSDPQTKDEMKSLDYRLYPNTSHIHPHMYG